MAKKKDYIDWGKEVLEEEIVALVEARDLLSDDFVRAVDLIVKCKGKVIVAGLGKSGHVGRKIAATLSSLGTPAMFLHAAEALHGDVGAVEKGDVIIGISHSGTTAELAGVVKAAGGRGVPVIAITEGTKSPLARAAAAVLRTGVEKEADPLDLAPTSSSTATLALGDALAVAAARARGFTAADFARLHPAGALGKKAKKKKR